MHQSNLDDLIRQIDQLGPIEKSALTKRLLSDSGINVSFGGNVLTGPVIIQVNAMDKVVIAEILEKLANQFTKSN